ncbi:tetraprenyl-beta-curcumene synthase family protein [Alteribacter keqinensis]|uniref:Tetraprenyl-beta-curcumene synthase family protein n=1 Tax=Alteribacter keqinensis TaxID=2483800 RepID=A0A3M7TPQ1_9BACI|nr:tetraprenyl-beta-curcumene synthase family protein [Alteribacter keqinensis]RNA66266.1 tetraprenyl-beta-curcumene synthase family protein [Alteribacter keqinensis]
MKAPTTMWTMVYKVYKEIVPEVHMILDEWRKKAETIEDDELREYALESVNENTFHNEGGGVFALLTKEKVRKDVLWFIVSYQVICDYLDSLCDQSDSLDPNDFRSLHEALRQALHPGTLDDSVYYEHRGQKNDNGFLRELVATCQEKVAAFPGFEETQASMEELSLHYRNLQVYKHVKKEDREPLLIKWYEETKEEYPQLARMRWYEFAASTGSTLGVYALAAYASKGRMKRETAVKIKDSYFPYAQGLHILLDYFIDQEEDLADDELNFCAYYRDEEDMVERIGVFKSEAEENLKTMPDASFHTLIHKGIIAIYLADEKVQNDPEIKRVANRMIRFGGISTLFFYLNSWVFRRVGDKEKAA